MEKKMDIEDRLKTYLAFTDVSRKFTSVMDAKAAFLSALNGGLLAFLWGSAKVAEWAHPQKTVAMWATMIAIFAVLAALWVISPREKFSSLVGKRSRWEADYKPVSFYGYIAKQYGAGDFRNMEADLSKMDNEHFAHEALEQHFNISRIIQTKSEWIFKSVLMTFLALGLTAIALLIHGLS